MSSTSMDLVERLYRRLVEAARSRSEEGGGALTIADLYQHLIPYRSVRGDLGVLELAEYEHALLRLLAGEGDLLRLANEEARRELAAELSSPNPILGIYRDYAGLGVQLVARVDDDGAPRGHTPEAAPPSADNASEDGPADVRDVTDLLAEEAADEQWEEDEAEVPSLPEIRYPPPRAVPPDATRVAPRTVPPLPRQAGADEGKTRCVACREHLPDVEGLRFCPHCGADQLEVSCPNCGSPIRSSWNFCIRCGSPRTTPEQVG